MKRQFVCLLFLTASLHAMNEKSTTECKELIALDKSYTKSDGLLRRYHAHIKERYKNLDKKTQAEIRGNVATINALLNQNLGLMDETGACHLFDHRTISPLPEEVVTKMLDADSELDGIRIQLDQLPAGKKPFVRLQLMHSLHMKEYTKQKNDFVGANPTLTTRSFLTRQNKVLQNISTFIENNPIPSETTTMSMDALESLLNASFPQIDPVGARAAYDQITADGGPFTQIRIEEPDTNKKTE